MKIISCVKQVQNLDMILKDDWVVDESGISVDLYYASQMMNPFDEIALELMLRLKDNSDFQTEVITVGDANSDAMLQKTLAVGADHAVRVNTTNDMYRTAKTTASLLYEVIKEKDAELVLCGKQADSGNHGQTGQILAKKLGWPCFTDVTDIIYQNNEYVITRLLKSGTETITVKGSIVITVIPSGNKFLRMATLKDMLSAKNKKIELVESSQPVEHYDVKKVMIDKPTKQTEYIEISETVLDELNLQIQTARKGG